MFKKLSAVLVNSCCIISIATTGMITAGAANDRMIGDVDMNGYVDAMDAASILTEAAHLAFAETGGLTDAQMFSADINSDGLVNAGDASYIMSYASYLGTGGTIDFVEYLNQQGLVVTPEQPEEEIKPTAPSDGLSGHIVSMTADEAKMLAALVTLESKGESYECQKAVASLVINRMLTSNLTVEGVIYQKNQFSTASRVASTTPTESCMNAVNDVLANGTTLPIYVTFFRAGYYHSWGDQVAYCCMDNTYFSYSQALKNKYVK